MTNPKAALMWVAVSMFLASSGVVGPLLVLIGLGASLSAMLICGAYALVFSIGIAIRTYGRFFRLIEASFGAMFGFVGANLVMDGRRDLRSSVGHLLRCPVAVGTDQDRLRPSAKPRPDLLGRL